MDSKKLAEMISQYALEKKAEDIVMMDLRKIASFTDYFLICSADSTTQVKAIADHIMEEMKKNGEEIWRSEGFGALNWILLDFVDVVVHIFLKPIRSFYNLEKMWGDAIISKIEDIPPAKPKRTYKKRTNAKVS